MNRLKPTQKWMLAVLLSAALTLAAFVPGLTNIARDVDYRALDLWMLWRGPISTRDLPILLVQIDDRSLNAYGFRSPTPRTLLGKVVRTLDAKHARCVGLDYLLDQPLTPKQDRAMERALAETSTEVVMVAGALPRFAEHAHAGHALIGNDARHRARKVLLSGRHPEGPAALAYVLYEACFGHKPPLPTDTGQLQLIDFYGPPSHVTDANPTFPVIAAHELDSISEELVRGRVVLVGSGLPDLGDTFLTAFSTRESGFKPSFGVEVHATILAMLMQQRFIAPLSHLAYGGMLLAFLLVVSATSLFTISVAKLLPLLAELAAWTGLSALLFLLDARFVPVTLPLVAGLTAVTLCEIALHYTEARHSRLLQSTFSRYVAPEMMRAMIDRRWDIELGGENYEVTILFADLENFTTFSEERSPGEVVRMLNDFFASLSNELFAEQGTIKDLLGDGIMSYFGAPLATPYHASQACRAALRAQHALGRLNDEWKRKDLPTFRMRIGVHSGEVVLGSIGSERRREIAVVGDTVNVASRLDHTNKLFGTRIVISDATLKHTRGEFRTRELGRVIVRGRRQFVAIHELLGEANGRLTLPDTPADHSRYNEALRLHYAGQVREARLLFREQYEHYGDRAAEVMALYCAQLEGQTLPPNWNGAVTLH